MTQAMTARSLLRLPMEAMRLHGIVPVVLPSPTLLMDDGGQGTCGTSAVLVQSDGGVATPVRSVYSYVDESVGASQT